MRGKVSPVAARIWKVPRRLRRGKRSRRQAFRRHGSARASRASALFRLSTSSNARRGAQPFAPFRSTASESTLPTTPFVCLPNIPRSGGWNLVRPARCSSGRAIGSLCASSMLPFEIVTRVRGDAGQQTLAVSFTPHVHHPLHAASPRPPWQARRRAGRTNDGPRRLVRQRPERWPPAAQCCAPQAQALPHGARSGQGASPRCQRGLPPRRVGCSPASDVPSREIAREEREMSWHQLGRTASRQILGSMNDFAFLAETYIRDDGPEADLDDIASALRTVRPVGPFSTIRQNGPPRRSFAVTATSYRGSPSCPVPAPAVPAPSRNP